MLLRLALAAVIPAVVVSGLALPVLEWPGDDLTQRDPVAATAVAIAISGIDKQAVQESQATMVGWEDLVHHHGAEVLGLVPASTTHSIAHEDQHEPLEPAVATPATSTDEFGLIGVTADEGLDPKSRVLVRVREDGVWSAWQPLTISDHGPDPSSPEAEDALFGTDPLLTSEADGVQVRIDTPGGEVPTGLQVMLIDNPVVDEDAAIPTAQVRDLPISTVAAGAWTAPQPTIITRAEWGADERLRRAAPKTSGTIKAGFIHHTASTNNYAPEAAAQQVRNLYTWFTKGRKYSDIAYNFLVDRYGRIYEGRGGGLDQPIVGAHTAGFNSETFAISAIGNYHTTRPNPEELTAVTNAMSSVMAWKLAMHHRDPNATTTLISDSGSGTSRFKPGQAATALVVGGHGDIGSTSCPGRFLEPQLPTIRAQAVTSIGASMFNPTVTPQVTYGAGTPTVVDAVANAPMTWQLAVTSRCGAVVRTLGGAQEAPGQMSIGWDQRDDAGNLVPPGVYSFTLQAAAGEEPVYPWTGGARILATNESPIDPCGAPESFALTGAGFGHGVGMSQWGAYGMAQEGRDATSIVTHYYTGTTVQPVQDDMDVRINLQYQVASAQVRGEAVDAGGGTIEVNMGDRAVVAGPADSFRFVTRGASIGIEQQANGQVVDLGTAPTVSIRWAGTRNPGGAAGPATLLNVIGPRGSFGSAGHRFRHGHVEITPITTSGGTRLNVVNIVRLRDEYLYGVSEVSSSWPEAALQAQVLAARSYALNKINKGGVRRACDCHMDNGMGPFTDQTFTGWTKQSSAGGNRWVNAVNATHTSETTGLAILHNGEPINAFYSSSSGGRTNASRDVWGGDLPFVQSVDDPWSLHPDNPNRSWTVNVPQATVARAFGVGEVQRLEIAEQSASGGVKTMRAVLADGSSVTRTGSQIRSAFGLRSAHVTAIDGQGTAAPQPPAQPAPVPAPTVAPSPDSAVQGKVSMKVGPSLQPRRGASFTISGKVKGNAKTRFFIHRQALVNGEWKTIDKVRTNKKGRYTIRVKKARPAGAEYTYRVIAVKKKQVVGVSRQLTVTVQPRKKG